MLFSVVRPCAVCFVVVKVSVATLEGIVVLEQGLVFVVCPFLVAITLVGSGYHHVFD